MWGFCLSGVNWPVVNFLAVKCPVVNFLPVNCPVVNFPSVLVSSVWWCVQEKWLQVIVMSNITHREG